MAAELIDGTARAAAMRIAVAARGAAFAEEAGRPPGPAVVLVGDDADRAMKLIIRFIHARRIAAGGFDLEIPAGCIDRTTLGIRPPLGSHAMRRACQELQPLEERPQLADAEARDDDLSSIPLEQSFRDQPDDRFTHGCARNAGFLHQARLVDHRSGHEVDAQDATAQLRMQTIRLAC